ncbi:MAG: hypothetical protein KAT05_00630, partial [Spirochaetes bacterium]|nr:hypothetical protein [Spirochaetota bacterium]
SLTDLANVTYTQQTSDSPEIQITGPDPASTYKDTITVDIHTVGGGSYDVIEIKYQITSTKPVDSGVITLSAPADFTAGNVVDTTFDFDSNTYVTDTIHDIKIEVWCTNDNSSDSLHMTTYLRADNYDPLITIDSPTSGTINGTQQQIQGTCSDWSTVKALYISYFQSLTNTDAENNYGTEALLEAACSGTVTPQVDKWFKIESPSSSWSHDYDTTVVSSNQINPFYFHVVVVDTVGNINFAHRQYNLDQDTDRPNVSITQPSYAGSITTPWNDVNLMDKFGSSFLITGTANDDDGVDVVKVDIHLMNYTGSGHSIASTVDASQDVTGTINWSHTLSDLTTCASDQYYMITPYVKDINLRQETGSPSFFIVSNETPKVEILWPSTVDPDGDKRFYTVEGKQLITDVLGTVISNVMDDIYWDNNNKNNHMYLDDSPKFFFGWDNDASNDDGDNNGFPDVNNDGSTAYSTYCSDFDEISLNIFNNDNPDGDRTDYFRIIFRSKDGNADGNITKVQLSYDGGSNWETAFYNNGNPISPTDTDYPNKYAMESDHGDGYSWFYVNLDTTSLSTSEIIKVKVTDDNNPTPYFSIATVQVTSDNNAPTGSFTDWGTQGNKTIISSSSPYIAGTAVDIDSGIRYAKLYIWDNEGAIDAPTYYGDPGNGSGSGSLTASIDTRTYKVDVPDIEDIDTGAGDIDADYMLKADMYTSVNWRIQDIYSEINPSDGVKLVCLQVIDNAGNTYYDFEELYFSEYPPAIDSADMWWNTMIEADKIPTPGDTTSDRIWISEKLHVKGSVSDDAGDPDPGINRVRILIKSDDGSVTHSTWSTEADGDQEITGGTGAGAGPFNWELTPEQDTSADVTGLDGNYLMIIEVQDKAGVIYTQNQYVYIDNTLPLLTVDAPTEAAEVTGSYNINGTASDAGGFENNCLLLEIYNGVALTDTTWDLSPSGGNWSQWWDTSSPATFTKLKVTLTDKAKNETVIERNISRDPNPPDFKAGTYQITDEDGTTDLLTFSTFTDLYSEISGNSVYIVKQDLTFDTIIEDDDDITDSGIYLSGIEQDGGATTSEPYQSLNPSSDTAPSEVGGLSSYTYTGLSSGEYTYRVWIEQQSGAVEVNLTKKLIIDDQKPHIWIEDMQYTDYVEDAGTKYGHIDVGLDSNGKSDGVDDVSGVIYVDVKAFENYLMDNIEVRCTDIDFGNGAGAWTTILDRNNNTGVWTEFSNGVLGTDIDYWSCTLNPNEVLKENKNWISITFEFNTANVTNIAGLSKNLEFRATDIAGNLVDEASQSQETAADPITYDQANDDGITYIAPDTNYQKIARKTIDIVPYISELDTGISGITLSYIKRSALGRYPVKYSDIGTDLIRIKGYNLNPDATDIKVGTFSVTIDATDDTGNFTWVDVRKNPTESGALVVTTNSINSINNDNSNDIATNSEAKTYFPDLNDDRHLSIWQVESHTSWTDKS